MKFAETLLEIFYLQQSVEKATKSFGNLNEDEAKEVSSPN